MSRQPTSYVPNGNLGEVKGERSLTRRDVVGKRELAIELLVDELNVESLRVTRGGGPLDDSRASIRPVGRSRDRQSRHKGSDEGEGTAEETKKHQQDERTKSDFFLLHCVPPTTEENAARVQCRKGLRLTQPWRRTF